MQSQNQSKQNKTQNNGPLREVDLCLLQHEVGESPADTEDLGDGVHDVGRTIDVRIQDTENVVELLGDDRERHDERGSVAN